MQEMLTSSVKYSDLQFIELHDISRFNCAWYLSAGFLRGFDGDAALLFIFARVSEAGLSGAGRGDDPSLGHQRVGQRRFPVVHVRDHGHVTDVGLLVHDGTDLVDCEVHLEETHSTAKLKRIVLNSNRLGFLDEIKAFMFHFFHRQGANQTNFEIDIKCEMYIKHDKCWEC